MIEILYICYLLVDKLYISNVLYKLANLRLVKLVLLVFTNDENVIEIYYILYLLVLKLGLYKLVNLWLVNSVIQMMKKQLIKYL